MKVAKAIIKTILWIAVALILLPIGLVLTIYNPMVQEIAIDAAIKGLNSHPHRQVNIESARLAFPLSLTVNGLSVIEESDTTIGVQSAKISLKLHPLIDRNIEIEEASLVDATLKLGTPDSSLYLKANNIDFNLSNTLISLNDSHVEIDKAKLKRGKMRLAIGNDTTSTSPDSAKNPQWRINANLIELNNVDYGMTMLPSIDSLHANISYAALHDGNVDLGKRTVKVGGLSVKKVNAVYLLPSANDLARYNSQSKPESPSESNEIAWTISADSVRINDSEAIYAINGATPSRNGLDFNNIHLKRINIAINSFYNQASTLKLQLQHLSAQEKSGLRLKASGEFSMDSLMMKAENFNVATNVSTLNFDAHMGIGNPATNPNLPIGINGKATVGFDDIRLLYPASSPWLALLSRHNRIIVRLNANGSMNNLNVKEMSAQLPGHAKIDLTGLMSHILDFNNVNGKLKVKGDIRDINFIKPTILNAPTSQMLNFPPLIIDGTFDITQGLFTGKITAKSDNGIMALEGYWNGNAEKCDADLNLNAFPIHSFLPKIGIGPVTGSVKATINGFDIYSPSTKIDAEANIKSIIYQGEEYNNLKAVANVSGGNAELGLVSYNPNADFQLMADGNLAGDTLRWNFDGEVNNLDLLAMKLSTTTAQGAVSFHGDAIMTPNFNHIDSRVNITEINWHSDGLNLLENNILIDFISNQSQTAIKLNNRDLHASFNSPMHLESIISHASTTSEFIDSTLGEMWVDAKKLQKALPTFELTVDAGNDNLLTNYLAGSNIGFKSLTLNASNDTLITLNIASTGINSGTTHIDDAAINITQVDERLYYNAKIDNNPGTLDEWAHIAAGGYLSGNKTRAFLHHQNIDNETGYRLGAEVELSDSTLNLTINPHDPVIAYKRWSVNPDNYLRANLNKKHFDANVDMKGNGSSIRLFTRHDEKVHKQEDVVLQVENLHLADWLPTDLLESPIGGDLNANVNFGWNNSEINGGGTVGLKNLLYGKQRVGSFDLDVDVTTNRSGMIKAEASLLVDSVKTITAVGNLNDSTKSNPLNLDFSMIRFPLHVVNPFLPKGTAKLSGMLNGEMDISGTLNNPMFNGYIDFDTTAVKISMLGSTLNFAKTPVAVNDNVVKFEDFKITGINNNALTVDGTVDLHNLSHAKLDLELNAQDMQIVGSERSRGVDVYGKAFIDLNATARGSLRFLDIDASLSLLPGSNVTYVLPDAQTALSSTSDDEMVKWVNLSDSSSISVVDTIASSSMLMDIDAKLEIKQGAILNVDISTNGKNKAQVQGSGLFTYSQSIMNDARFIGRYNIDKGFVRYTPPMMSEKHFDFEQGSYIAFNGDILNPILNIHAIDEVKANVTSEGQNSRRITFDVGVSATNTLSNMNVVFDLSTDEDITVQNELQSMSPEQRANQAMNILLYGMYTGAGSKGDANGNYLYSFLESRLNSWVSNNIKWVDLSFGIDQYDQTTDGMSQTTTSYSYKLSKTLFNDRFKVSIGGNYSTNADADENLSQNLINDISVEYFLNKSGSMSVRLFRHVGYESILEGEVTQTGVGFIYRRKIRRIGDMFRWFPSRKKSQSNPDTVTNTIQETHNETK